MAHRLLAPFDRFLPLVRQGMQRARVRDGQPVCATAKVLSRFEPHTRGVTRRKRGAPVEFGRRDEVDGGIVTRLHVRTDEDSDCRQALPAVHHHRMLFGRPPWRVTGDHRRHPNGVAEAAPSLGVPPVVIPRTGTLTVAQRARERQRGGRRR